MFSGVTFHALSNELWFWGAQRPYKTSNSGWMARKVTFRATYDKTSTTIVFYVVWNPQKRFDTVEKSKKWLRTPNRNIRELELRIAEKSIIRIFETNPLASLLGTSNRFHWPNFIKIGDPLGRGCLKRYVGAMIIDRSAVLFCLRTVH